MVADLLTIPWCFVEGGVGDGSVKFYGVATVTITEVETAYPTEDGVLMSGPGSGSKSTRPFTLTETPDIKIVFQISGPEEYVVLGWFMYPTGERVRYIDHAEVTEDVESFEFYVAKAPPGDYYLKVLSANCKWKVKVILMTTT